MGFVKAVVESRDDPDRDLSSSEPVIVRAPQYFRELMKLLNTTEPRYTHTHTHSDQSHPQASVPSSNVGYDL